MNYNVARKLIESQYDSLCDVYEYQSIKGDDKITRKQEVKVLEAQKCRISFSKINTTNQSTGAAEQSIVVKLFISPDITINPGSKLVITKGTLAETYANSGMQARYETHQEIMLTNFERWA